MREYQRLHPLTQENAPEPITKNRPSIAGYPRYGIP